MTTVKIQTVLGEISPEAFGVAMSHVHLTINLIPAYFREPDEGPLQGIAHQKVSIENLGLLRRNGILIRDNLVQDDLDLAIREVSDYVRSGGSGIVCVDLPGMGRDVLSGRKISRATGVHVVASTGWYLEASHPRLVKEKTMDELCDIMVKEIRAGIAGSDIKAGNIGEVAMTGSLDRPFEKNEEKVLRVAAHAQRETGVSLNIHPSVYGPYWETYLDILEKEGAQLEKVYMAHAGFQYRGEPPTVKSVMPILERGAYASFDQLGHEELFEPLMGPGAGYSSDREEVRVIAELCKLGYEKQILLSAEVALKTSYKRYGGFGYSHVIDNIIAWLRAKGVTQEQIKTMTVDNPRKLHSF